MIHNKNTTPRRQRIRKYLIRLAVVIAAVSVSSLAVIYAANGSFM